MKNDLLCIASSCLDLIFTGMKRLPAPGTEEFSEDFVIKGGGGANTPVAASRLGLRTAFITQLGKDLMGEIMLRFFRDSGMNTEAVIQSRKKRTSVTAVMSLGHERGFASFDKNDLSDVDLRFLEDHIKCSRHVHSHIAYVSTLPIIELAEKHGCTISIDTSWSADRKADGIKDILRRIDIFTPNEVEACTLTGTEDAWEAARILSQYVKVLVVKLGAKGCLVAKGGELIEVPPVMGITPVDTTGAGDLFNAGFLYGFLSGFSLDECARWGNASGALAVTFPGGMDDSFTYEAVKRIYENNYA
ncbi:MAG TPA: carbohydrate kinase family protein [Candidatus Atribacteria bacterium]|nr:carbohydrate kinase family protein [Candidatus Atribacteria bacterium]